MSGSEQSTPKESRRQFERHPFNVRIISESQDLNGKIWFDTDNISEGGAFLTSDFLLDIGERLTMRFPEMPNSAAFDLTGVVVWVNLNRDEDRDPNLPGMGIAFDPLDEAARTELNHLLNQGDRG